MTYQSGAGGIIAGSAAGGVLGGTLPNPTFNDGTTSLPLSRYGLTTLAAPAASIAIASIPQTAWLLRLILIGRGTVAATNVDITLQFNGDTGANYDANRWLGDAQAGNVTANLAAGQITMDIATLPGSTAPANAAGHVVVDIPLYAGTTFFKSLTAHGAAELSATAIRNTITAGLWHSTAAIASVLLIASSGSFAAGTTAVAELFV